MLLAAIVYALYGVLLKRLESADHRMAIDLHAGAAARWR